MRSYRFYVHEVGDVVEGDRRGEDDDGDDDEEVE